MNTSIQRWVHLRAPPIILSAPDLHTPQSHRVLSVAATLHVYTMPLLANLWLVVLPLSLVTLSYRARRRARQSAWVTFSSRSMGSVRAPTPRLSKGRLATRRFVTAPSPPSLTAASPACGGSHACIASSNPGLPTVGCTMDVRIWSPGRTHLRLVRAAPVWLHVGVRYVRYGMPAAEGSSPLTLLRHGYRH